MSNPAANPAPTMADAYPNSRELFSSGAYTAHVVKPGLVVQSRRTGRGILLPVTNTQYPAWVDAIETSLDRDEGDALCRALLK